MSLKAQIESDIKKAMLSKNKQELLALRAIKSAILIAETEKGAGGSLSHEAEVMLLMKAVKQRKDSAEVYQAQSRQDLADKELAELEVINRYLPEQMSEDKLREELKLIIEKYGASSPADMGKVMGIATKQFAGKADGKTISILVRSLLSN
ncbi:MAG: GatB/YqeY domain-containing protein [Bacteroidetes bacterium]|nr:GatB/YqeY domain-containing protein [Bacteroidota bacterium]MCH8231842.1 GatB/YqeY domain-containing protein [Bacteroidota bacterium]